jgi:hypothetical protein
MEPRKSEKPGQSSGEGQTAPHGQEKRKRRFQIIKLEERIAPGGGKGNGSNATCGNAFTCHDCHTCA